MANHLDINLPEHEKLASCPYNKAHQVVQHRLDRHIIKCKRSHGGVGFSECMFNSSHIFPNAEINEHQATCPERASLERFMVSFHSRSNFESCDSGITCASTFNSAVDDDDWDDQPAVPTYNPRKAYMKADIIIDIKHGTPALRRAKREEEHIRLTEIRGLAGSSSKSAL